MAFDPVPRIPLRHDHSLAYIRKLDARSGPDCVTVSHNAGQVRIVQTRIALSRLLHKHSHLSCVSKVLTLPLAAEKEATTHSAHYQIPVFEAPYRRVFVDLDVANVRASSQQPGNSSLAPI